MDLGFSRRHQARKSAVDPLFDFRMLLADVSARQAITPTAQAQAAIRRPAADYLSFAAAFESLTAAGGASVPATGSFHAPVARTILSGRQYS